MPRLTRVVIVGTGALARAAALSLAQHPATGHAGSGTRRDLEVVIVGRSRPAAEHLALVANAVASGCGSPPRFQTRQLRCSPLGHESNLTDVVDELRPAVCLCAASLSSSWEKDTTPSRWTQLSGGDGFGLNLAMHTAIVAELARAVAGVSPETWLINACYPDAVNRVLRLRELPVLAGIGNISTTALALQQALGHPDQNRLRVLAHHRHLYPNVPDQDEALLWVNHHPIPAGPLLAGQRAVPRAERYPMIGTAFARLTTALLDELDPNTVWHLPGPDGLVAGHPVTLTGQRCIPLRPPGMTPEAIEHWAQRQARADGVSISTSGTVSFHGRTQHVLEEYLPDLAGGIDCDSLDDHLPRFVGLRSQLRTSPVHTHTDIEDAARAGAGVR